MLDAWVRAVRFRRAGHAFGTARKGIDESVRDAVEYAAGELPDERTVEFVAKEKFDLAGLGRQFGQAPFALEAPEGPAIQMNRHPVRTLFRVPGREVEAKPMIVDGEPCRDHTLVPGEDHRIRAPRKKRGVMLGRLDQIEGASRGALDERRPADFHGRHPSFLLAGPMARR